MFELILAAALTAAPPARTPPNPCTPAESCRYVGEFPLKDRQGEVHPVMVKRWVPYLSDGRLTLFPGEVVSLTLSDAGPVVTAATVLTAEDRDPAIEAAVAAVQKKTEALGEEQVAPAPKVSTDAFVVDKDSLRIVFVQTAMGDMMLRVGNGYDRLLSYHAFITKPGAASAPTSVCAVLAKISSVESWAPPILAIDLGDFQLQPNGTAADCR